MILIQAADEEKLKLSLVSDKCDQNFASFWINWRLLKRKIRHTNLNPKPIVVRPKPKTSI